MSTRNLMLATTAVALSVLGTACERVGERQYEVERPVVGTQTDTVRVPMVDVGTDTQRVVTPDVDITTPAERRDTVKRQ